MSIDCDVLRLVGYWMDALSARGTQAVFAMLTKKAFGFIDTIILTVYMVYKRCEHINMRTLYNVFIL